MSRIDLIKRYFRFIEQGDLEGLTACYEESAIQIEMPNQLKPKGDQRTVAELRRDFAKGGKILLKQSYEIVSITENGDRSTAEVLWRGTLAVPLKSLRVGDVMTAHSVIIFEFKNGRIAAQRNYDCFDPF